MGDTLSQNAPFTVTDQACLFGRRGTACKVVVGASETVVDLVAVPEG